ncbi:MAG: superoxide dismutase [Parachlamydiaceae bacterium]|nr:superoxide dismutase [Parachlamydiaceae bacterium]
MSFQLPALPYALDALEPVISADIMSLHYNKHHAGYVNNLNKALEHNAKAEKENDITKMIELQAAIKFNGGGHINHSIFWTNLAPKTSGGGVLPSGALRKAIEDKWQSIDKFIETFNTATGAVQGSGWGWLGFHKETKLLCILTCPNQDPVSMLGYVPLLGIDVWEHAYYLQYKNARPDYLKAIWEVVNWKNVEERYAEAIR